MRHGEQPQPSTPLTGMLESIFNSFKPDPRLTVSEEAQLAAHLAAMLQRRATLLQTRAEKKQQSELERMIQNPHDKATRIPHLNYLPGFAPQRRLAVASR